MRQESYPAVPSLPGHITLVLDFQLKVTFSFTVGLLKDTTVCPYDLRNVSVPRILIGARDLTGYSRYRLHRYPFVSLSLRCRVSQEFS